MWNICDCFFSLCSLSYYSSSACQEVLQSHVWAVSSSFYFGHKCSKASIRPKFFNYSTSYPTMNPTRLPWLITKSSVHLQSFVWTIIRCQEPRGTWMENDDKRCLLVWGQGKYKKSIPYNATSNVPIMYLASSSLTYCAYATTFEIRPKFFNYSTSYPTTNPTHLPWLITKSSRFICSPSCGYEPKITLTSSSKQS